MTRNEKSLQALFSDNVNDYPHKDYIRKQLNEADKELDKLEDLYDTAEYFAKEDNMVGVNYASRDMKEDTYTLKRKNLETKGMLRDSYTRSSRRPIKSEMNDDKLSLNHFLSMTDLTSNEISDFRNFIDTYYPSYKYKDLSFDTWDNILCEWEIETGD